MKNSEEKLHKIKGISWLSICQLQVKKILSEYSDRNSIPRIVKQCDNLMKSLNKNDIKTLDLIPVFSVLPQLVCYFRNDNHMTVRGHQVIASSIYRIILPEVIKRKRKLLGIISLNFLSNKKNVLEVGCSASGTIKTLIERYH